jgi:acetylornithine deacetylase/succinyl-diaminopimelate desuccinylase-like protein
MNNKEKRGAQMKIDSNEQKAVLDLIQESELVDLTLKLGNIASPTGHEKEVGEFILDWLADNQLNPCKMEAAKDRFAISGQIRGQGKGFSLLFNSHMDTWIGSQEDRWILGREVDPVYNQAWQENDFIVGAGVVNDKGPMAATMLAVKALKESSIRFSGDIIVTMVPGEIGQAPIDEYQGSQYWGKGLGARYLVDHGVIADFALVAEATEFCLTRTQCGAAYFKISVKTDWPLYTPYIERPTAANDSVNAIVRTSKLIEAIEEWSLTYEKENEREYPDGPVVPKVNIGAIRGGLPYKPSATPCICCIYLDVRIPPHRDTLSVKAEIDQVIAQAGIVAENEIYLSRKGYEGQGVSLLVDAIESCYQDLAGKKVEKIATPYTSMWRDMNVFNAAGIPAVTFGPSRVGQRRHTFQIENLHLAAKVYAMVALDIVSRNR